MAGFSDYVAGNTLRYVTGFSQFPTAVPPSVWLGLFTTAPTNDTGTFNGTEVTGGSYARVQVAGSLTAAGTISTGSATITMPTNPGWVVPGMNVWDSTNAYANGQIGTVLTYIGTTLTLTGNASHNGTGSTDNLVFSAFQLPTASSGTEPAVIPENTTNTGAVITFPQATANWGTVTSWGLFDSSAATTNQLWWDYLGNFKWLPFTCTNASPSVLTSPAHGYANSDSVVLTYKFDGNAPTGALGTAGTVLTVAGVTTDTYNLGTAATSTGSGQARKIIQQSIPINVTASFASAAFILSLA